MKALLFSAALSTALLAGTVRACAGGRSFRQVARSRIRPVCVSVSEFKSVAKVTELKPEQFQFVRAFYVAIPPVSPTLPPGDHAIMASSGGDVMLALVTDGQACARFLAPPFIQAMVIEVGEGRIGHIGTPTS